jgi:acyl-CoA synthetase (AMP-forming)/AMP-acid ligase II
MDLALLLEMATSLDPARIAVTDIDGASLSTGELAELVRATALKFEAAEVSHVGYCGTNGRALPVALFAAATCGIPFVPLNYRLADDQLADVASRHQLLVVAAEREATRLRRLGVSHIINPSALLSAGDVDVADEPINHSIDPESVALLLYTSGSTAAPKAAVLRHRHLTSYVISTVEFASHTSDDAVLVSVPPYHVAGIMNLLTNLYSGRRIVYLDPFDPQNWLDMAAREHITHSMLVPTMLARIVDVLGEKVADLPHLASLAYGGAKMPARVIEKALRLFPQVAFTNAYGLTETSSTIALLGPEAHRDAVATSDPLIRARLHSVGLPLPGIELEVRTIEHAPCEAGQVGDIYVRGDQIAGEYVGSTVASDGWFATRDRGYLDQSGFLFIEGRADDTIIRGGENIAPAEIEEVLLRHEAVVECAVVGIDDEEWGQRIAAAVVLSAGSSVAPDMLKEFARSHLRSSKTPDVIALYESLPYTETGKLLRRTVRQQLHEASTSLSSSTLMGTINEEGT